MRGERSNGLSRYGVEACQALEHRVNDRGFPKIAGLRGIQCAWLCAEQVHQPLSPRRIGPAEVPRGPGFAARPTPVGRPRAEFSARPVSYGLQWVCDPGVFEPREAEWIGFQTAEIGSLEVSPGIVEDWEHRHRLHEL